MSTPLRRSVGTGSWAHWLGLKPKTKRRERNSSSSEEEDEDEENSDEEERAQMRRERKEEERRRRRHGRNRENEYEQGSWHGLPPWASTGVVWAAGAVCGMYWVEGSNECTLEDGSWSAYNPVAIFHSLRKVQSNPLIQILMPETAAGAGAGALALLGGGIAGLAALAGPGRTQEGVLHILGRVRKLQSREFEDLEYSRGRRMSSFETPKRGSWRRVRGARATPPDSATPTIQRLSIHPRHVLPRRVPVSPTQTLKLPRGFVDLGGGSGAMTSSDYYLNMNNQYSVPVQVPSLPVIGGSEAYWGPKQTLRVLPRGYDHAQVVELS